MKDLASRLTHRVRLTTDGHHAHLIGVQGALGYQIDWAQFSKKLENLGHAVALHFMYYNFGHNHQSLRITPAMAVGISDHVWELEEIAALTDGTTKIQGAP